MARTIKSGRGFNRPNLIRPNLGYTLLEMMIVIVIIGILLSIALPIYNQSILRSRESVLHNDLFEMRKLITQYTLDKQKAPQSLDDLVQGGYIKQIPKDPMTGEANWEAPTCDELESVDQQDPGICDVHSASNAISSESTAYSTW
jgi:general secretion pathway protein G